VRTKTARKILAGSTAALVVNVLLMSLTIKNDQWYLLPVNIVAIAIAVFAIRVGFKNVGLAKQLDARNL